MKNFVITIARGFGSGGKEIGNTIAQELGICCYEKQILTLASQISGLNERLFISREERLKGSVWKNQIRHMKFNEKVEPQDKKFVSDENLFRIQANIIKELANTESCVIIGKCADDILKDYPNVLSVYVEAPREECIDSIMGKMGVPEEEAVKLIVKTDKYRTNYYKAYTGGKDWTNPTNYDLTINTARMGRKKSAQLIIDTLKIKFGEDILKNENEC